MPKRCAKFVSQYLIPSLNTQRFGKHLKWIDKKNSIFELDWCHKGGPTWTKEGAGVFVEWDKIKGHYHPEDKQYYTKSKQRFRALLYKLTLEGQIKKLRSADKYKKIYSIGEKKMRKKKGKKESNAGNTSLRNDEMLLDDDINEFINEMDMKEIFYGTLANELNDHNYSSLSNSSYTPSDSDDLTTVPEVESAVPMYLYGLSESPEKKVLVERNFSYSTHNMILDEDFKNLTVSKCEGLISDTMYDLPSLTKNICENLYPTLDSNPTDSQSSFSDLSPFIFDHIVFDSSTDGLLIPFVSHADT